MSNRLSIRTITVGFILATVVLTAACYSLLVGYFFVEGMQLSVEHRLELEAKSYARQYNEDHQTPLPKASNFRVYEGFKSLPAELKHSLHGLPLHDGQFVSVKRGENKDSRFHFVYAWRRPDNRILYFVYSYMDADGADNAHAMVRDSRYAIMIMGGGLVVIIVTLALLMVGLLARRQERLTDWASRLDEQNVDDPPKDFGFIELNQLAEHFRDNTLRHLAGVRRERWFLHNASHELRTPIAVMQANLDWMARIGAGDDERLKRPLAGMDRAVRNMRSLVETLLSASRKEADAAPRKPVRVDTCLREIVHDNLYLLEGKDVKVEYNLSQVTVSCPESLARIIWSNIMRNAFQHTQEGRISVRLSGDTLDVINDMPEEGVETEGGFGLGLMLIGDLTRTLGWEVALGRSGENYSVSLIMREQPAT